MPGDLRRNGPWQRTLPLRQHRQDGNAIYSCTSCTKCYSRPTAIGTHPLRSKRRAFFSTHRYRQGFWPGTPNIPLIEPPSRRHLSQPSCSLNTIQPSVTATFHSHQRLQGPSISPTPDFLHTISYLTSTTPSNQCPITPTQDTHCATSEALQAAIRNA